MCSVGDNLQVSKCNPRDHKESVGIRLRNRTARGVRDGYVEARRVIVLGGFERCKRILKLVKSEIPPHNAQLIKLKPV